MTPADRLAESDVVRLSSSGTGVDFDGDEDCCLSSFKYCGAVGPARRGGHATSKHRVRNASSTIVHYPPVAH
ncbi:hypothetical protein KCU92_g71, partial [Aureobasidium melanogenum]